EIFHDVLAPAVLDWRSRYLRTREVLQAARRGATALLQLAIGIGWLYFAIHGPRSHRGTVLHPLFIVWGVGAVVMWVSATVELKMRWRRRSAALVPLVGAVASALGPVTASVAVIVGTVRGW